MEDKAFIAILVAAGEAYPSKYRPGKHRKPKGASAEGEVHGLLFGQRINKGEDTIYNVTMAVPNQIIYERNASAITPSLYHIDSIKEMIDLFPPYQFLGCFHSHPYKRSDFHSISSIMFSNADQTSALAGAANAHENMLEVIFGITCLERCARTKLDRGRYFIHNCCGVYKYTLACYEAVKSAEELLAVDNLICPAASGTDRFDFRQWKYTNPHSSGARGSNNEKEQAGVDT
jgi:hypothetical protein